MAPASITASTVILKDAQAQVVPATVTYGAASRTVTIDPDATLLNHVPYTVTIVGGPTGVKDLAGNPLASDYAWTFTTAAAQTPRTDPNTGPGGPVLVVTGTGTFGSYLKEILRAEGLNLFGVATTSALTAPALAPYTTVVLAETTLTSDQVTALTAWVTAGGNLIAVRPDAQLAGLLGLSAPTGTLSEGYIKVDTSTAPGQGIVSATMQFHGTADLYTAQAGTQVVAELYSTASTATGRPAVTLRSVGSAGGSAAAFTYDLAGSVVKTRQGNPAWINQNRDGQDGPNRSDDLYYGAWATDPQPDYVDRSKIDIPQADEQQRLLANVMTAATRDALPLPRFWYLPRGKQAVIVMTADNHDNGSSATAAARMNQEIAASAAGCSVADWECIRSTVYLYPANAMTNAQAKAFEDAGLRDRAAHRHRLLQPHRGGVRDRAHHPALGAGEHLPEPRTVDDHPEPLHLVERLHDDARRAGQGRHQPGHRLLLLAGKLGGGHTGPVHRVGLRAALLDQQRPADRRLPGSDADDRRVAPDVPQHRDRPDGCGDHQGLLRRVRGQHPQRRQQ